MNRYRIMNNVTEEWWEGEASSAQEACQKAGWLLVHCWVRVKTGEVWVYPSAEAEAITKALEEERAKLAVAGFISARDYWDANLEYNPLRYGDKDTQAGAALSHRIEQAGDMLRELGKPTYVAEDYIFEKFESIRKGLRIERDWVGKLSQGELDRLNETKKLLKDLPTPNDTVAELKILITAIANRDVSAIWDSLNRLEPMLRKQVDARSPYKTEAELTKDHRFEG